MDQWRSYEALAVLDRLVVGPVIVEERRLTAPYTVHANGAFETTELIYKYEEPVFTPGDPASENLASMVAAQAALNYGLFCRELVFHGTFDEHDKRFLSEMAENTAREIYVNKILADNPFLADGARGIPAEKLERYLTAALVFGGRVPDAAATRAPWSSDGARHAVLLSGGKDSLLTYGLLRDAGVEAHPVFVNESGRHWYTALNAYRHFSTHEARTTRVWTNSDRVFTWMLRRLPMVRPDFATRRSDAYPIRLWTVAVFLFGALPLLRKRGCGRLLVGDEYDTTVRRSTKGIPHFDGLYDQSRYFDHRLTRYFTRKRWNIAQFSVLRPLSELLIQKTLVERYPELQRHQISCHAAHIREDRAFPCGKCEKCRRIVGMLSAFGLDPGRCGYTPRQVAEILGSLPRHALHQETEGAEHLMLLLKAQGLVEIAETAAHRPRPHPEVLSLRFEKERSPIDLFPNDLRAPLYRQMLQHAAGAVIRSGRQWQPFDPLSEEALTAPYRFETPAGASGKEAPDRGYLLADLTWQEARDKLKQVDIALFPVGSIEQHGPHLPLDVDAYDADRLCRDVAAACSDPKPLVLPAMPYGVSYHHDEFAGTLSISPDTLSKVAYEVGMSVARQGITKLIIVNGHGGNGPALHFAAQMINRDARIFTCVDTGETSDAEVEQMVETRNDVHAGEIETSTTLALRPHRVKMNRARRSVPRFSSDYLEFSSKKSIEWYVQTARLSKSGVLGDPTKATEEKGRRIWAVMVKHLVGLVEDLKPMTLDDIYQKRY